MDYLIYSSKQVYEGGHFINYILHVRKLLALGLFLLSLHTLGHMSSPH